MNAIEGLTNALKRSFCTSLDVSPVPIGFAINTGFYMPDGDLLSFYLTPQEGGLFRLEDDGTTLPNAVAAGLDLKSPIRENLLRGILADEGVHYDTDLLIHSDPVKEAEVGNTALRFISALIRMRDLSLLSRENIASTFADDIKKEIARRIPNTLFIADETNLTDPGTADITLKDRVTGIKAARIFAAGGDLRLMDALSDYQARGSGDSPVIAVVDRRKSRVSEKRFNNATNRGLPMAVIDGDSADWVTRVLDITKREALAKSPPVH